MGKSAPSPPPAPDPAATAAAQATANKESAIAQANINMVNQVTPYGNLEYTERGEASDGTPQYTATQTLSNEQQQILDQQNTAALKYGETANNQLNSVAGTLSQPLDFSGLGDAPVLNEATRDEVATALYDRLNPQFDRERTQLETSLANQGFQVGTEAYDTAIDELNRSRNDARLAVENNALGQAAQLYGLEATQRDKAINEMVQQRSVPLNELAAMMSGSQVSNPQFISAPQQSIAPADIGGYTYANYNGAQNAYAQQVSAQNANTTGLYGLLGSGAMAGAYAFSDRRLKTNIKRIGTRPNGLGVYVWTYLWGVPAVGYMADEVKRLFPAAVKGIGGFDAVNYAEIPNG